MMCMKRVAYGLLFFFNDTATTEIYTLSLHDALPIFLLGFLEQLAHLRRHRLEPLEHVRSEEHTSELQSHSDLVCRLLLEKKNKKRAAQLPQTRLEPGHRAAQTPPSDRSPRTLTRTAS